MDKLTTQQEAAIGWHLQNNVFNRPTPETASRIIDDINAVRTGEKKLEDFLVNKNGNDTTVTIGEMIEDLKLGMYVEQATESSEQDNDFTVVKPSQLVVLDYSGATVNYYTIDADWDYEKTEAFICEQEHTIGNCEWMSGENIEIIEH